MGSLISLIFTINIAIFVIGSSTNFAIAHEETKVAHVLDRVLGDYALRSYTKLHKTGSLYKVHLPANLSGVRADMVRFRCGSLRRYGAKIKEFHLGTGITVQPCMERVVLVRQNLGLNWSQIYYGNYNISGYQLISPILGLLAYDSRYLNSTNLSEVRIFAEKEPITIDFSSVTRIIKTPNTRPLCASFGSDGKVSIYDEVSSNICLTARHGHFGLVIDTSMLTSKPGKVSEWKIIIGSSVGGAIGVFLLGLLFVALIVKAKKRSQMAEMERKAYEEEALQISMVGHVRMPVAPATRTQPYLEHEYSPP
ncbi:Protein of unknown function DUF1191 [Macleaya cordata]|uniref:Legume lectin domain n=1 Tax=Macleaya cordata TaxID=56857 RepID=A0A200PPN7_MACCD|nr:Protein of unknown function DUF1191 [Macleaya cordata]